MKLNASPIPPDYGLPLLKIDIIAGLSAAAVVIPKALAIAVVAGLPVETGLFTALVPMAAYALLGSSRRLSVSSTTTIAILTGSALAGVLPSNADSTASISAATTLAFLVGVLLTAASLLRMGFLAYFISAPVLTGFKAGVGLVIIIDQLPKVLGTHIHATGFFREVLAIAQSAMNPHLTTLIVGVSTLILIILFEKKRPGFPIVFAVAAGGIIASKLFFLSAEGVSIIGYVPSGLPNFSFPDMGLIRKLLPAAAGIALISFVESSAAAKSFLQQEDPPLKVNRELLATGIANIAGGFLQAMPSGGGTSQTAVNSAAGARSQVSSLVTAGCALLTMLFLTGVIGLMPLAVLGAIVIAISMPLIRPSEFSAIWNFRKTEFTWSAASLIGVLVFGTLEGVLLAVALSVLMLLYVANHPPVYPIGRQKGTGQFRNLHLHPEDESIPGLLILRTEGMLTFASIPRFFETAHSLHRKTSSDVVVLDLSASPDIEYTAVQQLTEARRKLVAQGIDVWIAGLNERPLNSLRHLFPDWQSGKQKIFETLYDAVQAHEESVAMKTKPA